MRDWNLYASIVCIILGGAVTILGSIGGMRGIIVAASSMGTPPSKIRNFEFSLGAGTIADAKPLQLWVTEPLITSSLRAAGLLFQLHP